MYVERSKVNKVLTENEQLILSDYLKYWVFPAKRSQEWGCYKLFFRNFEVLNGFYGIPISGANYI